MAKQKVKEVILRDCSKCVNSIGRDNNLYCKNMILDLSKPFSKYSEIKVKRECPYYREIK